MTQHEELLKEVVGGAFLPKTPDRIGIAVSGGGDSMALMVMLAIMSWFKALSGITAGEPVIPLMRTRVDLRRVLQE